jgi:chemotaxis protein methyltransferase CheR
MSKAAKGPSALSAESDAVRPLEAREFDQIRQLAYRTFGLDLKAGKEELVSARLRRLVQNGGFRSFSAYLRHVLDDRTGDSLSRMIDALATNHTSFLREPEHFEFLQNHVLPGLKSRQRVEVWSAACSTGEEVWTLACLLNDVLRSQDIRIIATDISNKALQFAQRAVYSDDRCQGLPAVWRSRYFIRQNGPAPAYTVEPRLRSQAVFRRLNLVEEFALPNRFPAIFCRNVMIYFDRSTQEHLVRRLAACLEPGGYLFVGHAESLTRVDHRLEYVRPAIYRRPLKQDAAWNASS